MTPARTIPALTVAALAGSLVYPCYLAIWAAAWPTADEYLLFAAFAAMLAVPSSVLAGLVSIHLLRRHGLLRWWTSGLVGAGLGALVDLSGRLPTFGGATVVGVTTALLAHALLPDLQDRCVTA